MDEERLDRIEARLEALEAERTRDTRTPSDSGEGTTPEGRPVGAFAAHPIWWTYQDDIGAAGLAVRAKGHAVPDPDVIGVIADAIAQRLHARITRDLRNGELFITPSDSTEGESESESVEGKFVRRHLGGWDVFGKSPSPDWPRNARVKITRIPETGGNDG